MLTEGGRSKGAQRHVLCQAALINEVCLRCTDARADVTGSLCDHHGLPDVRDKISMISTSEEDSITRKAIRLTQCNQLWSAEIRYPKFPRGEPIIQPVFCFLVWGIGVSGGDVATIQPVLELL